MFKVIMFNVSNGVLQNYKYINAIRYTIVIYPGLRIKKLLIKLSFAKRSSLDSLFLLLLPNNQDNHVFNKYPHIANNI